MADNAGSGRQTNLLIGGRCPSCGANHDENKRLRAALLAAGVSGRIVDALANGEANGWTDGDIDHRLGQTCDGSERSDDVAP